MGYILKHYRDSKELFQTTQSSRKDIDRKDVHNRSFAHSHARNIKWVQ